ncbi:MAG TPA: glycoside hydrolase domain-containing protein [Tepidisphaeraceae bacterium]|jgi:hypothetical protein|nr:glycoside hydrolase domain-containing protein [Tepidisphaeraceae bacterium]
MSFFSIRRLQLLTVLSFLVFFGNASSVQAQGDPAVGKTAGSDAGTTNRPVWLGNKIGISDKVPKPWTPVEAKASSDGKATFNVWGRSYQYDGGLFPSQITALNNPLLAAPIKLVMAPAPDSPPAAAILVMGDTKPGVVHFQTTQGAIKVDSRIEFDGMMWFEVTLPPGRIEALSLEIPLRPEMATLQQVSHGSYAWEGPSAVFPGKTPKTWSSAWQECMWLGNENAGLSWFAESQQYWSLSDRKRAMEITQRDDRTILKINLVTRSHSYKTSPVFRFGIEATPMRPMLKDWRALQFVYDAHDPNVRPPGANMAISWWMSWSPHIGSPFEVMPTMKATVDAWHQLGVKVIPYNALWAVNEKGPEVAAWKKEWEVSPFVDAGGEGDQILLAVGLKSSYADYFIYGLHEMLKTGGWDGFYFDFGQGAVADSNKLHNSGYVDERGVRRPTYDILAQREFLKRVLIMFQDEFGIEDPLIMLHLSDNKIPPLHGLANIYFDGEQFDFSPVKVEDDYTKVISLDRFRAEFLGTQFGGASVLLPELGEFFGKLLKIPVAQRANSPIKRDFDKAIDTVLIFPFLHGTILAPDWLDQDYVGPLFEARAKFGMGDARFVGYWEKNSALTLHNESDTLKASAYVKKDKLWLVVANLGTDSQTATVTLDLAKLGATGIPLGMPWKNVFGVGDVPKPGKNVDVNVPAKSLRILELGN